MILFVPPLGTHLQITRDWTFQLYPEDRNISLFGALDIPCPLSLASKKWNEHPVVVVLRAGTVLSVSRIYIRNGAKDFDSMTFYLIDSPDPELVKGRVAKTPDGKDLAFWMPPKGVRFWAKLLDVNGMECEIVRDPPNTKKRGSKK